MRRTLILLTIFLALLGIILFSEKRNAETPESVEIEASILAPNLLFAEKKGAVIGLKIVTEDADLELLRGADGLWDVIQPSGADVEQGIVEAAVAQVRALPLLAENLALPASDVGIREQAPLVSVTFAEDGESAFWVGDLTPSGNGYYIRYENEKIGIIEFDSLDTLLNLSDYFGF